MSIVQHLMLKSFVIFCKYVISKVSCLVSVSSRLFAQILGLGTSMSRVGFEDFSRDSSPDTVQQVFIECNLVSEKYIALLLFVTVHVSKLDFQKTFSFVLTRFIFFQRLIIANWAVAFGCGFVPFSIFFRVNGRKRKSSLVSVGWPDCSLADDK